MRITVHVYGCNYVIFVIETCVPVTSFPKKNRERKSHHYKIKSTEKNRGKITFQYGFDKNRLISAGIEPVLRHTEKSCILSYYTQFCTNIQIKILELILV